MLHVGMCVYVCMWCVYVVCVCGVCMWCVYVHGVCVRVYVCVLYVCMCALTIPKNVLFN